MAAVRGRSSAVAAAAAWSPLDLASLVAWWDYSTGVYESTDNSNPAEVDDAIPRWVDRKGGYVASQATGGAQPILKADGLLFDGTDDGMLTNLTINKPYTLLHVSKATTIGGTARYMNSNTINALMALGRGNNNCYLGGTVSNFFVAATGTFYLAALRVSNSTCAYSVDGTDHTDGVQTNDWGELGFGSGGAFGEPVDGAIAHVLVCSEVLSAANMNLLGAYFATPGWSDM
jgi:hypothetical protein